MAAVTTTIDYFYDIFLVSYKFQLNDDILLLCVNY